MIILWYLGIALLSFTRIPMWVQLAMTLAAPIPMAVYSHDITPVKVAILAALGALVLYAPLALLASFIMSGGFRAVFRRLRFVYFVVVLLLFVLLVFNMSQLV